MSDLIKSLLRAASHRSGKKKRAKRKTKRRAGKRKPKIVFRTRTRTIVKVRRVRVKGHTVRRKTSKKRRAKKSGKRKLQFGSPAWRKKYMKGKRR